MINENQTKTFPINTVTCYIEIKKRNDEKFTGTNGRYISGNVKESGENKLEILLNR